MRVIFGIGNPGKKYEDTKHNIGFSVLDYFTIIHGLSFTPSKFDYNITGSEIDASRFFLVKPTTYVNLSGIAALDVIEKTEVTLDNFLVVVDDVNLPLGKIRIRNSGGDGGHNGISSIIYQLQSDNFPRLRIGIGSEFDDGKMADYVLSKFDEDEKNIVSDALKTSAALIENFIAGGIKKTLEHFSQLSNQGNETGSKE